MTEEIKYIANLQRQEEFDNEVTELKDELKRLEQENEKLSFQLKLAQADYEASEQEKHCTGCLNFGKQECYVCNDFNKEFKQ